MKVIIEIPENSLALSLTKMYETETGLEVNNTLYSKEDIEKMKVEE